MKMGKMKPTFYWLLDLKNSFLLFPIVSSQLYRIRIKEPQRNEAKNKSRCDIETQRNLTTILCISM